MHIAVVRATYRLEIQRHEKIKQTIRNFDYGSKNIAAVFCNALQSESGMETFDFAETTSYFSVLVDAREILPENLLMDTPDTVSSDSPHWFDDITREI